MLSHLTVQNFATVAELELEPTGGLTVVTGATGAGKSVIVDALGLALGNRADSAVVRPDCERAEVQVCFDLTDCPEARAWLTEQELDDGDEVWLRRTVRHDGRSRAWINGSAMPLQKVRELGDQLIDIHSQHEHQALLRRDTHRALLDNQAGATELAAEVRRLWNQWRRARQDHQQALDDVREQGERQELLRFQLEELDNLDPGEQELAELEAEQKRLAHAESLIRLCNQSVEALYDSDEGTVNDLLGRITGWVTEATQQDSGLSSVLDTLESARLQVEAATDELRHYLDRLELDPERLQQVEERIGEFHTLARKHRVRPEELPEHRRRLQDDARKLEHQDEYLAELEQAEQQAAEAWEEAANRLSATRREHAGPLARGVIQHLKDLGMEGAHMEVSLETGEPGPDGYEQVEFLFTANPGQPLRPLAKVASGGELSRISLAIQVICARALTVPCLVFDEVDVGVGGGVAEIVGRLLRELGEHAQVLCITHQPQVAALGHQHWQVHKDQTDETTYTGIEPLDAEERVHEVARMLGGVEMTDSTLEHAREMVEKSGKGQGARGKKTSEARTASGE